MAIDLASLLQQYAGGGSSPQDANDHFDQAAAHAPSDLLSQGIQALFQSNQTPPFPQLVGQMFGGGNQPQQSGMVNQLLATVGPALLAGLIAKGGSGALSGLSGLLGGAANTAGNNVANNADKVPELSPQQVAQLTPLQVQELAHAAEQQDPGIVAKMSQFYADHPTLVKTLGGFALTVALSKMADAAKNS
jgi:hypothetical protein